jgi:hypothetical protein
LLLEPQSGRLFASTQTLPNLNENAFELLVFQQLNTADIVLAEQCALLPGILANHKLSHDLELKLLSVPGSHI